MRALPERTTCALNAVAAIHGGIEPDIVEEMYWSRVRDVVEYAVVAYVRVSADGTDRP